MQFLNFGKFHNLPIVHLSPYALGIAAQYKDVSPWFCTIPTTLTNVAREEKVVVTEPLDHDVLIVAGHSQIDDGFNGQNVLLQISDLSTGLLWTVPSAIQGSPSTAYGGVKSNVMPVIQLPEAFFLPAGVRLKHVWKTYGLATGGDFTWIGIRLKNPVGGVTPKTVVLPDGSTIPIGSRLPWFNTLGLGEEISVIGSPAYVLGASNQFVGYSAPMDCPVSITGLSANWFVQSGVSTDPQNLLISVADKGQARFWSAGLGPSPSLLGDPASALPILPFTIPYELQPGDRMQFSVLNQNALALNNGYLTLRGVRHCAF